MKESGHEKPLIIVFDREGYDGKLLTELDSNKEKFTKEVSYKNRQNKEVKYRLHKENISIANYRNDVESIRK
jgi:hypothetical protein